MNEQEKKMAEAFDALESDFLSGNSTGDTERGADLRVLEILRACSEPEPMPRGPEFTREVMGRVKRSSRGGWIGPLVTMAAVLTAFLLLKPPVSVVQPAEEVVVDEDLLKRAMINDTRSALHEYLVSSEKLLVAMRGADVTCSEDQMDLAPEKEFARELLVKQKLLSGQIRNPEFHQARHLVDELERILVDINNLDLCTDPDEIDFINEHVAEERLLMKLRLIAQNIQVS